jgi:F0F1-type ATP synthase assembly protein I
MVQFIVKTFVSAIIIAIISTVSKKYPGIGGLITSIPLTSLLAMIWLYQETQDAQKVISLSNSIFWMILPSLVFFIVLPIFIRYYSFYPALIYSIITLFFTYLIYLQVLKYFKIYL